jgi:hypothetical protein
MSLSVHSVGALEQASAALTAAVEPVENDTNAQQTAAPTGAAAATRAEINTALVQGGFVERILGEVQTTAAAPPAEPPGVRTEKGVETATLQTMARPHATVAEPPRPADTAPQPGAQANAHAPSDFALAASLLVPVTLTGLVVEHATAWPLPGHGFDHDPETWFRTRARDRDAPPPPPVEEFEEEQAAAPEPVKEKTADADTCGVLFNDEENGAWCEALTRALRLALAAKIPPHALLLAAEQWRRGRCVVLACPQYADPAGPAWAFVLWPRKQLARSADGSAPALSLFGVRVEARLQWSALRAGAKWCHTRVIKEHHARTGRQLVPTAPPEPNGRVGCEIQLGPVLARPMRCCDVCVRINAARRFWNALGTQWSVHVIVSSHALIDADKPAEDAPC